MPNLYRPAPGRRVPMSPGNSDWPSDGLPVDFSNPYQARLVKDGDLVPVTDDAAAAAEATAEKPKK
ncbi:hypothetical protein [Sinorhizobium sp. BG8]|uniref:hypothetical protein n=1 Tax=Sinorhizobium sp. BG8 TaxID=2613773 RepID=UPI00193E4A80|nr:hypothetical protein [Sinorhizobium sp. BG8]QRM55145.1 hypothetical protein F3Y30_11825 [Sinorhizobium sp. BG8]